MRYLKPTSIHEAADALESSRGTILAGGTDLCVYMAEGVCQPETLIDISGIDSMRGIETIQSGREEATVRIGAGTTVAEVAASEALPDCLRQGAQAVGSPQIRNLGTIGGNVCNASPCGDTLTPLLALDARFVLRSTAGTRTVESEEFFTGPKQTVLDPHEILEFIELPSASCARASAFRMIGNRKGQAISQVNAAVSVAIVDGVMSDVRVAVGSVAPVPLRLAGLEELLSGKTVEDLHPANLRDAVLEGVRPIDDVRSTATYRQEVTVALVFDALAACGGQRSGQDEGAGAW
ncbi:MAG: xanthine dehydrogenase family protein subunit M [Candidatus Bipolaricaulota bacterium]|nr:MAG: xanthine dehydrogenase family protein subunit M [Candidatus Bipolaricaulota bacterium]